ncbi:MAG TPA: hypothetical protein VGJ32_03420, partial [Solirubrobacteraceae bacterium]
MPRGADDRRRIVVIGPGKIGCGHLAPLFDAAGWEVVLAARNAEVVDRIRAARQFTVRVPGGETQRVAAAAVPLGGEEFERAVAEADLAATAVGARNVVALGEPLARALAARPDDRSLDVWAVENGDAAPALEAAVRDVAAREGLALPPLGVAGAIAWRAVTSGDWKTAPEPVFVADATRSLVVDGGRLLCAIPDIPGISASRDYAEDLMAKFLGF